MIAPLSMAGALMGGVVGAVVGSFAATAALRMARGEQALRGSSHCDGCDAPLSLLQATPLISFVQRRGRCPACKAGIDLAHPIGEAVGLLLGAACFGLLPPVTAVFAFAIGQLCLFISVYDLRTKLIPDLATVGVFLASAGLCYRLGRTAFLPTLIATALVLVFASAVSLLTSRIIGRRAIGSGDLRLIAALVPWCGLDSGLALAGAAGLGLLGFLVRPPQDGRLPFAPCIALAFWAVGFARTLAPAAMGAGA